MLVFVGCGLAQNSVVLAQVANEYEIKAAYLEKVARFIDWPENSISSDSTINVCVIGRNTFGNILEESYSTRTIKNKKVTVYSNTSQIKHCDILFIASDKQKDLLGLLQIAQKNNILTFSDTDGFAEKGVHVNFYTKDERIFFEINLTALKESGFNAGSLLLDYAKIVKTKK